MASAPPQSSPTGKQRVLEAAQELFGEGAYGDIGVAQILEKAGVQAPTLYHHFGDKENLFVVWAEEAFRQVEVELNRFGTGGSTEDSLCRYASALLVSINFDLYQILRDAPRLHRQESRDRVLGSYMRAVYEPLATILVQAVATGEFRNESVAQLSDVYLGGLMALKNSQMPSGSASSQASWWCHAFSRAFGNGGARR